MRPFWFVLGLGTAGLMAGMPGAAQSEDSDWQEIAEGLYVYASPGANVAARVTATGVVLVDTPADEERLLNLLDDIGAPPISHVVNTHHHPDHTGGNGLARGRARVITPAGAWANMQEAGVAARPDLVFTSEVSVFAGDIEVRVHAMGGGHTDGDAVVQFPDLGVIHTGDLVVAGTPIVDYEYGGGVESWVTALGDILALDFQVAIPGHGSIMTRAEVQRFRDKLLTLRARIAQLIQNGVPKEEIAGALTTEDLEWPLDVDGPFVTRSLPRFYDELAGAEPVDPAPSDPDR